MHPKPRELPASRQVGCPTNGREPLRTIHGSVHAASQVASSMDGKAPLDDVHSIFIEYDTLVESVRLFSLSLSLPPFLSSTSFLLPPSRLSSCHVTNSFHDGTLIPLPQLSLPLPSPSPAFHHVALHHITLSPHHLPRSLNGRWRGREVHGAVGSTETA